MFEMLKMEQWTWVMHEHSFYILDLQTGLTSMVHCRTAYGQIYHLSDIHLHTSPSTGILRTHKVTSDDQS